MLPAVTRSLCVCLITCLGLCLCLSVFLCLPVCLSASLFLSLSLSLLCLSLSLSPRYLIFFSNTFLVFFPTYTLQSPPLYPTLLPSLSFILSFSSSLSSSLPFSLSRSTFLIYLFSVIILSSLLTVLSFSRFPHFGLSPNPSLF